MDIQYNFDCVVVGSGFGGSVASLRMTEKGDRVCLLERGKSYGMHEFPRRIKEMRDHFFWDPRDNLYGLMEVRDYLKSDLISVTASGLGGGSLIYANVLMRMPENHFAQGWPTGINRHSLEPYYDKVINIMEASPYPLDTDPYYQDTPKTKTFKMALDQLNPDHGQTGQAQFILPDMAVRFKGEFPGEQSLNTHGALQSKCNKCGECDIGCNIHAKNTLDLNYIFKAKKLGLDVRTQSLVTKIAPIDPNHLELGYEVTYQDLSNFDSVKMGQTKFHSKSKSKNKLQDDLSDGLNSSSIKDADLKNDISMSNLVTLRTKKVILSAGSLGSTGLLLKMKKYNHLPRLSSQLGKKWCGNGDLEGTVFKSKHDIEPTKGPVITGAYEFKYQPYPDGFSHSLFIQEAGYPIGLAWYLSGKILQPKTFKYYIELGIRFIKGFISRFFNINFSVREINIGDDVSKALDRADFMQNSLLLLGMGRDRSDGYIELNKNDQPEIYWSLKNSQLHYDRVRYQMSQVSKALGGSFIDNPLTYLNKIVAVHPIGGCPMGDDILSGVVDKKAEVFGYPGLYVIDASIIPTSLGPNPSLTIAALAEMVCDNI